MNANSELHVPKTKKPTPVSNRFSRPRIRPLAAPNHHHPPPVLPLGTCNAFGDAVQSIMAHTKIAFEL